MTWTIYILAAATTIAGIAMAFSYFFQIAKILKTKSVQDISLPMFVIFCIGLTLWSIYGIVIKNWPLIIVNVISIFGAYTITGLIIKYRK